MKKVLLEILQNLQENTCARISFLIKLQAINFTKFTGKHLCQSFFFNKVTSLRSATLLNKKLWHRCFPLNFVKFLRAPFLTEHFWWLLLSIVEMFFQSEYFFKLNAFYRLKNHFYNLNVFHVLGVF